MAREKAVAPELFCEGFNLVLLNEKQSQEIAIVH